MLLVLRDMLAKDLGAARGLLAARTTIRLSALAEICFYAYHLDVQCSSLSFTCFLSSALCSTSWLCLLGCIIAHFCPPHDNLTGARAGADAVYGAEVSQHMCDVGEETTIMNGFLGALGRG